MNLVDNALHSFAEVKAEDPQFQGVIQIKIEDSTQDGKIRTIFEDNGPGIDPELKDKIFDPYISSKSSGMGLGLAIVRRITEEHSGIIFVEEAAGARFVIDLPAWGK